MKRKAKRTRPRKEKNPFVEREKKTKANLELGGCGIGILELRQTHDSINMKQRGHSSKPAM